MEKQFPYTVTLAAANTYTGATTVNFGTLLLGADNAIPSGSSVTVQGGGMLDISAYSTSAGTVTLMGGTITGTTGVLTGSDYDVRQGTISAKLGGSAGLTKRKGDTVVLSATNTYTGATTIEDGTLKLAADATMASKTFDVNAGATLDVLDLKGGLTLAPGTTIKGGGTVLGDLVADGTVTPGSSPGILTVEDITFSGTGTLQIELGGLARGTEYDVLAASGTVTLQSGSTLAVTLINAFVPQGGDEFDILDFAGHSGQFDTPNLPALGGGLSWDTSDLYTSGTIVVAPEPASAAMLIAGVVCTLLRRRAK
ncbi:MAG: autotransporter-associated beta strand repeat-containing protein [Planctomycetota bacterium]|nr:autotransporter-associated beta strand repeat-containing protein [Planctomycetota bacterium]